MFCIFMTSSIAYCHSELPWIYGMYTYMYVCIQLCCTVALDNWWSFHSRANYYINTIPYFQMQLLVPNAHVGNSDITMFH